MLDELIEKALVKTLTDHPESLERLIAAVVQLLIKQLEAAAAKPAN